MKRIRLPFFILLFFALIAPLKNHAQTSSLTPKVKSAVWQQLSTNGLALVNYKYEDCNMPSNGTHNENVYLQFVNLSTQKIKIEWNTEYWYNDKCYGCNSQDNENKKTLLLEPGEIKTGVCSDKSNDELRILSKMLNVESKTQLTNFNLRNLQVTSLSK